ncbi:MAG: enoyl-ACP reductase [bacterium]
MLQGKLGIIFGVANYRSIAWAIAQALARNGMRLAFTYQGERLKPNVEELAATLQGSLVLPCDVTRDEEVGQVFETVDKEFGGLDCLVHAVAFARKEDLDGSFVKTSREGFQVALDVSSYSLVSLAQGAAPLMGKRGGGSIIALSYLGGVRVVPNYNVMGVAKAALEMSIRYLASDLGPQGIRVNGISAGPIKTLAAKGIAGFSTILDHVAQKAPLRRNTEIEEVADTALFLASPLSRGVTANVIYVDSGYQVMGM